LEMAGVAAGLHVLARLPAGRTEQEVVAGAAARGVAVTALGPHAVAPRPPALVLGYTRLAEPGLGEAGRRVRAALD
jgi:GntR family transcriptional regulator / MocR family aminotransferase